MLGAPHDAAVGTAKAVGAFWTAVKLRPSYGFAHYELGNVAMEAGRHEEASELFRTASSLRPSSELFTNNLGVTRLKEGKLEEAADAFLALPERASLLRDWRAWVALLQRDDVDAEASGVLKACGEGVDRLRQAASAAIVSRYDDTHSRQKTWPHRAVTGASASSKQRPQIAPPSP